MFMGTLHLLSVGILVSSVNVLNKIKCSRHMPEILSATVASRWMKCQLNMMCLGTMFVQKLTTIATGHTSEEYIFKRPQKRNFITPMLIGELGLRLNNKLESFEEFWDPYIQH